MEEHQIEKNYKKLAEKYKLPSFEDLDSDFEISTIDSEFFLLRNIRRRIVERIENHLKFLESILIPESTSAAQNESSVFTQEDYEGINKLFKQLMYSHRRHLELEIIDHEKNDAAYITKVYSGWSVVKEQMMSIIGKMKNYWNETSDKEERQEYFG